MMDINWGRRGNYVIRGAEYKVETSPGGVIRPNRTAAGMMVTLGRSCHSPDGDALTLAVRGTLARTSNILGLSVRVACRCCGSKQNGKLRLNERGRDRLRLLRGRNRQRTPAERLRDATLALVTMNPALDIVARNFRALAQAMDNLKGKGVFDDADR